jgi:predicted nucleic acid-binding protein
MYLVDTSILIDAQSARPRLKALQFQAWLVQGGEFFLTGVVYQEVLQGARDRAAFKKLERFLGTQRFVEPLHGSLSYAAAADIYARCRWSGITPRSTVDCLIAQIAVEHDMILLHDDSDYEKIQKIVPKLKTA